MNNETPPHHTPISGTVILFVLVATSIVLFLPNIGGMKTRGSSAFAATEVQMRPLIVIPDVATQVAKQKEAMAADIAKIRAAIGRKTSVPAISADSPEITWHSFHPNRLTCRNGKEVFFVEIEPETGTLRLGDFANRSVLIGAIDGSIPNPELQRFDPTDTFGYEDNLRALFGPANAANQSSAAPQLAAFADRLRLLADALGH